ncbi:thymidylate kinase-domain-containing protein [Lipomyces japonicus]|uniref:thymidylate kinase-domain-containing protein n=1 Tax=Lipomyces japonicus TaxID=56871 RepID=UPI0034D019AF
MTSATSNTSRGVLILLEGLDRAGKTTQCQILHDKLAAIHGLDRVRVQKFPDRTTSIGSTINSYLTSQSDLSDPAIHLLFSANRWELRDALLNSLKSGKIIILDRYVPSGVAYSLAKQNPDMPLEWCLAPDKGLPEPDLTIFLDIDPGKAHAQSAREDFGKERYEVSEFQTIVRKNFKLLLGSQAQAGALKFGNVVTVDATESIETVAQSIWHAVESFKLTGPEITSIK